MTSEESIAKFDRTVAEFSHCIESLDDESMLSKLNNWSPRDIIAHLIGWNYHFVKGLAQIRNGELPFYDVDPGENYCNVNAEIIQRITSTKKEELLAELELSADGLKRYIESLSSEDYSRDFGVRHKDEVVTIENTLSELIEDYNHHKKQIEEWSAQH